MNVRKKVTIVQYTSLLAMTGCAEQPSINESKEAEMSAGTTLAVYYSPTGDERWFLSVYDYI